MIYTTLFENPNFLEETLTIIEESFDYSDENSFSVDFSPLMDESNWKNCHLLVNDGEVIGHIGVLNKILSLEDKEFTIAMYGGIAIAKKYRGKGLFSPFFESILSHYQEDVALHMLWSDQLELYEKFSFYPCVDQYEYNQDLEDAEEYLPTKLHLLTDREIKKLESIYNDQPELRFKRDIAGWNKFKKITSTDLYLKRNGSNEIENYFFMNKGEDLSGVIIEVGDFDDFSELVNYGVLWSPHMFEEDSESLYATMVRRGSTENFKSFISSYTKSLISIESIEGEQVRFKFEASTLELTIENFLTGVLGPNCFEELKTLDPLYISGLDSI